LTRKLSSQQINLLLLKEPSNSFLPSLSKSTTIAPELKARLSEAGKKTEDGLILEPEWSIIANPSSEVIIKSRVPLISQSAIVKGAVVCILWMKGNPGSNFNSLSKT